MVTATKRRSADIVAAARPIAAATAEAHGLVLWAVGFLRDAGQDTLRIAADKAGGISSGDLATFSEDLSRAIDAADVVPGEARYTLEVTSPGAERKLVGAEQFRVCVGRTAKVSLKDGRSVEGVIAEVSDSGVEFTVADEGSVRVLIDDISRAQLVVKL